MSTAEEREETLGALRGVAERVRTMGGLVATLGQQVAQLNGKVRSVERKMGLLYTPFQSSVYEYTVHKQAAAALDETSTDAPPF